MYKILKVVIQLIIQTMQTVQTTKASSVRRFQNGWECYRLVSGSSGSYDHGDVETAA